MIIESCLICKFHEIREEEKEKMSHCGRENCWARYSKCVAKRALDMFLRQEALAQGRDFSALGHINPRE